eukprot:6919276-Prymnesium_polylepis.1
MRVGSCSWSTCNTSLRSTADGYGGRDGRTDGKGGTRGRAARTSPLSHTPRPLGDAQRREREPAARHAPRAAARGLDARRR